jgi:type IV secretion system protein VirB8
LENGMTSLTAEQRKILKSPLSTVEPQDRADVEKAVAAASEAGGSYFIAETILGMRQREKRAWAVAVTGMVLGLAGVGMGAYGLAHNETQAYLAIVDKDTGIVERGVSVDRASVDQQQAVVESLIYAYVMDRETYDTDDNEYRILSVFKRSAIPVRQSLEHLWTPGNSNYPPESYGVDGTVDVTINNVLMIDSDTAQVRFTKTLRRPNAPVQRGDFVATVTTNFNPSTVDNNLLLWQNPFGFQVTGYRVASEGTSE